MNINSHDAKWALNIHQSTSMFTIVGTMQSMLTNATRVNPGLNKHTVALAREQLQFIADSADIYAYPEIEQDNFLAMASLYLQSYSYLHLTDIMAYPPLKLAVKALARLMAKRSKTINHLSNRLPHSLFAHVDFGRPGERRRSLDNVSYFLEAQSACAERANRPTEIVVHFDMTDISGGSVVRKLMGDYDNYADFFHGAEGFVNINKIVCLSGSKYIEKVLQELDPLWIVSERAWDTMSKFLRLDLADQEVSLCVKRSRGYHLADSMELATTHSYIVHENPKAIVATFLSQTGMTDEWVGYMADNLSIKDITQGSMIDHFPDGRYIIWTKIGRQENT